MKLQIETANTLWNSVRPRTSLPLHCTTRSTETFTFWTCREGTGARWDLYVKLQGETHSLLKLWKARSRLYRRRFLQPNTHFAAFFEIFKIYKPLHRSRFKICIVLFSKFSKICRNFHDFWQNSAEISFKSVIFHRDFHGFSPEFHRMSAILMDLMLQYSKSQNLSRKSRNFAERFCRNSVASFMVSPHPETEFHIRTPPKSII